jgi:hypothetical protein
MLIEGILVLEQGLEPVINFASNILVSVGIETLSQIMDVINAEKSVSSAIRTDGDLESQNVSPQREITVSPTPEHENDDAGLEDNSNVPRLALPKAILVLLL